MTSYDTRSAFGSIAADPAATLLATDFDGVLAPIVADPEQSRPRPGTLAALASLGRHLGRVVVVTGRPARVAVRLGGLDRIPGLERLVVLGQYGVERWDAATGEYDEPAAPPEVAEVAAALPSLLAECGWPTAAIEDKGRATVARLVLAEGHAFPYLTEVYRTEVYEPFLDRIRWLIDVAEERGELKGTILKTYPHLLTAPVWMSIVHNGLLGQDSLIDSATMFEAQVDLLFK